MKKSQNRAELRSAIACEESEKKRKYGRRKSECQNNKKRNRNTFYGNDFLDLCFADVKIILCNTIRRWRYTKYSSASVGALNTGKRHVLASE